MQPQAGQNGFWVGVSFNLGIDRGGARLCVKPVNRPNPIETLRRARDLGGHWLGDFGLGCQIVVALAALAHVIERFVTLDEPRGDNLVRRERITTVVSDLRKEIHPAAHRQPHGRRSGSDLPR